MQEIIKLLIGTFTLTLGFLIGTLLARMTKEELKSGQKWFRVIVVIGLIGGLIGLIIRNDVLLFTFFFITIVTSRSLKRPS